MQNSVWPLGFARSIFVALALFIVSGLAWSQTSLVPAGAVWKYLDNGTNQGTAWRAAAFDDSAWTSGPAELGYGDGDEATVISYGPNASAKYITSYFRKSFNVTNPAALTVLNLRVKRDDGIVVNLNGAEIYRDNMPSGTVAYNTLAASAALDDGATWQTATLSAAGLVQGANMLAVEVHQASATSSDVSFNLELTGWSATSGVFVTRGPYLQIGTPNSVAVRWRTNAASDSRVWYGTAPSSLSASATDSSATAEHSVTLTGLNPGTKYYYSVGTTTTGLAGGDANHYFVTSPAAGGQRATRVWVLGDAGTGVSDQTRVRDAYYNFTGTTHTDLWLQLGDNAYEDGTDAEYQTKVFNVYADMLRKSVTWPTIGNHDTAHSASPPPSLPYFQMFSFPTSAQAGGVASGSKNYYSFDFGNIHFVCLDSMASSRNAGGAMLNWLQLDLAANTKDWVVAYWHHPPYTKGSHDSDVDVESIEMRQNFLPVLESFGVDLVLSGHSHSYERSFLIDGHYGSSSTFTSAMKKNGGSGRPNETGAYGKPLGPSSHQGAVYSVAGASGKVESSPPRNHPAMYVSMAQLGSIVLDVNGNRLDATYLTDNGTVADSFTIQKGASSNQAPTVTLGSPAGGAVFTAPASIALAANASDADGSIQRVEFYQGTTLLGTVTSAPYTFTWTNVPAGTYSLTTRAYDNLGASTTSAAALVTVNASSTTQQTTLIAKGTTWKYLDNGSDQGTAWRATGFNDAAWASGAAQLGYGDGDEASVMSYGPNASAKYITTYFRKAFTVSNPGQFTSLLVNLLRDDGAVVYLNGTEIVRSNMPTGAISSSTTASSAVSGSDESTFFAFTVNTAALVAGTNVIAVEIHQSDATSSDISFDLELIATGTAPPSNQPPSAALTSPAIGASFVAPATLNITASASDADGSIQRVEFYQGTTLLGTVTSAPYTFTWTNVPVGTYSLTTRAYDNLGASTTSAAALVTVNASSTTQQTTLIAKGTTWKYLDNGSDQGTAWRATGFNDAAWASGAAQLGYGDGDEASVMSYGPNASAKYITTYFRKAFTVSNPGQFTSLLVNLLRDDGAVVYLNGTEIVRSNMPTGAISSSTTASSAVSGSDESTFFAFTVNTAALVAGTNVIAVEIHQSDATSSDISFDLELIATGTAPPSNQPPSAALTSPAIGASFVAPATLNITASASDADGSIQRVEFYQGTTLLGTVTSAPYTFTWTNVPVGTYSLTTRAYDNLGASTTSAAALVTVNASSTTQQTTLIAKGTTWKYLDNGSDQGTAWRATGFNDAAWASGAAQLGYGDGDEASVMSYGPNASAKYITTYFRKAFTVSNPGQFTSLLVNLLRDDGAVVYLNGTEIVRSNMPTGAISSSTTASSAVSGSDESTFFAFTVNTAALVAGTNVIAVEIHQSDATSSDISFDLELIANP